MSPAQHPDDELRAHDRDRWLATLWCPPASRPGLVALFALDVELVRIPLVVREPVAAQIRLAWWREALVALDSGAAPAQPTLRALAAHVVARVPGAALAGMEDAHLFTLAGEHEAAARARAGVLRLAARLLGAAPPPGLGGAWAAGEARRAGQRVPCPAPPPQAPRALRPLLALDRLGARDCAGPITERGSLSRQALIARTTLFG